MKILLVNKFHYVKGGSERYYFTLAEAFKAQGHEVIFFAMKDSEKNIECKQDGYFVSNASVSGGIKSKLNMVLNMTYSKEAYANMKKLLNDEKPDLVILNLVHKQITCSIIDAIKEYDKNLPIFWTMHDLITVCPSYTMLDGNGNICEKCLGGDFKNCFKNKCIKGSRFMSLLSTHEAKVIKKKGWYDKVDLFICPSEFYKNKLEQANFTKSPIVCMRNPLSLDTKYEVNDHDDGYLLYFGRLSREKGVATLIKAMKQVDYKLIVLGTGPIENELKELVTQENLQDKVSLLGFKSGNELENYIKNSRAVVLPSEWYENGPYSAMEAMALGKPLIVSGYGGLPELVKDGENGYIFKNQDELLTSITKIIDLNDQDYSSMCANSCQRAKENFNAQKYIQEIEKRVNKNG